MRKRFQEPLSRWRVGHLRAIFRVETGKFRLLMGKRTPQDTLQHRSHPHAQRSEVREPLDLVIPLDQQRGDTHTALEAMENTLVSFDP